MNHPPQEPPTAPRPAPPKGQGGAKGPMGYCHKCDKNVAVALRKEGEWPETCCPDCLSKIYVLRYPDERKEGDKDMRAVEYMHRAIADMNTAAIMVQDLSGINTDLKVELTKERHNMQELRIENADLKAKLAKTKETPAYDCVGYYPTDEPKARCRDCPYRTDCQEKTKARWEEKWCSCMESECRHVRNLKCTLNMAAYEGCQNRR